MHERPVSLFGYSLGVEALYERLTLGELEERRQVAPIAYLPLDTSVWHGPHLPLGSSRFLSCTRNAFEFPAVYQRIKETKGLETALKREMSADGSKSTKFTANEPRAYT